MFTLSVNSGTGVVTLTQSDVIDHTTSNAYNGAYIEDLKALGDDVLDLKASAVTTDSEGDTSATASALLDLGGNVKFGDDGPDNPTVVLSTEPEPMVLTFDGGLTDGNFVGSEGTGDTNTSSVIAAVSFAGAFTFGNEDDFGADGGGSTTISYALQFAVGFSDGDTLALTSGGATIHLYDIGGVMTASTSAVKGTVGETNTVFTLSVNSGP